MVTTPSNTPISPKLYNSYELLADVKQKMLKKMWPEKVQIVAYLNYARIKL